MSDGPRPERDKAREADQWIFRGMHVYRRRGATVAYRPDAPFFELADPIVDTKRTLLGYDRLYTFWQAVRNVAAVPGAVAEIGAYRGGSSWFIASALKQVCGAEVPLHVFDTFTGHPAAAVSEHDPHQEPGKFAKTSLAEVRELLSPFDLVRIHPGDVMDTITELPEQQYRLVHIDTDLYRPTLVCLDYFAPRLSPGGVIVLDDYESKKCPGVPKALAEFMARDHDRLQTWDMRTEQLMLIKR